MTPDRKIHLLTESLRKLVAHTAVCIPGPEPLQTREQRKAWLKELIDLRFRASGLLKVMGWSDSVVTGYDTEDQCKN